MSLADAHAHLFETGFSGRDGRPCSGGDDLAVYESLRRKHRIDTALVVGYEGRPQYVGNNAYVAGLADAHAWVAPVAFTPPQATPPPSHPFLGIAVFLESLEDVRLFNLSASPAAPGQIVSINVRRPQLLGFAADTIRRLEECAVLISHLGQPGPFDQHATVAEIEAELQPVLDLATARHVGVKVSGLYSLATSVGAAPVGRLIAMVADAFGPHRLYWGSDYSPALEHVAFAETVHAVANLAWSSAELAAVMGGNLEATIRRARRS